MVSFEQIILGSQEEKHRIMMKFADTTPVLVWPLGIAIAQTMGVEQLEDENSRTDFSEER